jgi:hypothetical protein
MSPLDDPRLEKTLEGFELLRIAVAVIILIPIGIMLLDLLCAGRISVVRGINWLAG